MTPTANSIGHQGQLECSLKNAVAQRWDELMPNLNSGLIHVEYQTGLDGSLDYLTVWASTIRGYWSLVCELWCRPLWSHITGLTFHNDYHSAGFAHGLERVVERHNACSKLPDRRGLVQVYPPQEEVGRSATAVHHDSRPKPTERPIAA